ncbi:MAG TPA: hypothetical protein DCZ69_00585, partial [Syntrophobacteraceae bacterium]|nr:hypothetical protein [Syntrophobacteraceae bacterium]
MIHDPKPPIEPLSLDGLRTTCLASRPSKVNAAGFATPWRPGLGFRDFLSSLPSCLAADHLRQGIHAIARAIRQGR